MIAAIASVCCAVVIAVAVVRADGNREPAPAPTAPTSASADPRPTPESSITDVRAVQEADLSWLAARSGYRVFVRTGAALADQDSGVYQVRPHADQLISKTVPGLASSGPVYFVPVQGGIIIRPIDAVSGYFVPDDGPVLGTGSAGGIVLPGPDPRHVWIDVDEAYLELVDAKDRRPTGAKIEIPKGISPLQLFPDGHGYALAGTDRGVYDLRPGGARRLAAGSPMAIGPTRLLTGQPDCSSTCRTVLLNQRFVPLKTQPKLRVDTDVAGVISPDGKQAALLAGHNRPVMLVDLQTGLRRDLIGVDSSYFAALTSGQTVFSPDSKWLFVVGSDHRAHAINVATGHDRLLLPELDGVAQISVRP